MNNFKIIEEIIDNNTLTIRAKIKLKNLASDPKVRIKTKDIIDAIKEKYSIDKIIEHSEICNFLHGNKAQDGKWVFQIQAKPETKTTKNRTRAPRKTAPAKKPSVPKNTSTKESIRGRMSKIAKEKQANSE
tara:strand:+ start:1536 stop:1928 length:393 start_codon:yes stop_codon:yes gene_type:complete